MKLKDCKNILKVGMKVKEVRGGIKSMCFQLRGNKEAIVTKLNENTVWFEGCGHEWSEDIELALEPSWDNLQVGMELESTSKSTRTILEVGQAGKTFLASSTDVQYEARCWFTVAEAIRTGWKIKGSSPAPEVIEISGKKYDKAQVEERVKELKPL